jgi:hypothetical protein
MNVQRSPDAFGYCKLAKKHTWSKLETACWRVSKPWRKIFFSTMRLNTTFLKKREKDKHINIKNSDQDPNPDLDMDPDSGPYQKTVKKKNLNLG